MASGALAGIGLALDEGSITPELTASPLRITRIHLERQIVPLTRAAGLLARCGRYVASSLAGGHTPSWQETASFAAVLTRGSRSTPARLADGRRCTDKSVAP